MSTITVATKNGIAAIAADSLTKWGYAKDSADYVVNHEKIIQVRDSYLAISGPSSAKLALRHYFSTVGARARLDSVDNIFKTWIALHEALRNDYFLKSNESSEDAFESSRMDVLIANPHGIFGVAANRHVQQFSKFYAYGGGSEYASGAMYAVYAEPSKSAEDIARLGVQSATEFHDGSGLPIISYTVKQAKRIEAAVLQKEFQ